MIFILIIIVFPFFLSGQNATIDSLKSAFKNAKHDTTKCNVLEYLISLEEENEPWLAYNIELKKIAEKNILAQKVISITSYNQLNKNIENKSIINKKMKI